MPVCDPGKGGKSISEKVNLYDPEQGYPVFNLIVPTGRESIDFHVGTVVVSTIHGPGYYVVNEYRELNPADEKTFKR